MSGGNKKGDIESSCLYSASFVFGVSNQCLYACWMEVFTPIPLIVGCALVNVATDGQLNPGIQAKELSITTPHSHVHVPCLRVVSRLFGVFVAVWPSRFVKVCSTDSARNH